jgi:hypothetical protein
MFPIKQWKKIRISEAEGVVNTFYLIFRNPEWEKNQKKHSLKILSFFSPIVN